MKALVAVAVLLTPMPVLASTNPNDGEAAETPRERKVCTRVENRSTTRIGYRRLCRTPTEWREALGADWRQQLAGAPPIEDQIDSLDARTRVFSTMPTNGLQDGSATSGTLSPR